MSAPRKRVLFVAENVSLAQVVRLKVLAASLDPGRFDVHFACSQFDPMIFADVDCRRWPIASISHAQMLRRLQRGQRPYDLRTLARYAREDMCLLERVEPALVVGDLRLSLAVAAPKLGVTYAALINAYWSPFAPRDGFPMPEHPLIDLIGAPRVAPHYHKALPFVFDHFARPLNSLRRRHGLPAVGSLLEALTHADHTLYPDCPELAPTRGLPASHHYLGHVAWSPGGALPARVEALDPARPLIYLTLGSSGSLRVLDRVLLAVSRLPVQVLLASAGRFRRAQLPANVHAAEFVPGDAAARRAALVICNGGSSTAYQALAEGVPVLGLPFNFDQYLSMAAIERAGAGRMLRSGSARSSEIAAEIEHLLRSETHRAAARQVATALRRYDACGRFAAFAGEVLGTAPALRSSASLAGGAAEVG